jgi:hypothetical protein
MTITEIQKTFGVTWTDKSADTEIMIKEYWKGFNQLYPNCDLNDFKKWIIENGLNGWENTLDYNSAGRRELKMLYNTIRVTKPKKILEIGTHKGCSTEHILLACKNNYSEGYPCEVHTIDIIDYPDTQINEFYPFKRFIGDSLMFLIDNNSYDFVIQDGCHEDDHVIKELNLLRNFKNLKTLWSHDYYLNNKKIGNIFESNEFNNMFNVKLSFLEKNYITGFYIGKNTD